MWNLLADREAPRYALHLNEIQRFTRLDGKIDFAKFDNTTFVFICFTNRCGSNFVAEAVASDGRLNVGEEFLNYDEVIRVVKKQNLSTIQEYFSGVSLHDRKTSYFVSKVGVAHLNILHASGIMADIVGRSKFIFIERSDKLDQAISHLIAEQTGIWASYGKATRPQVDLIYSRTRIDDILEDILIQNHVLERFFAHNGLTHLKISYEEFVRFPGVLTDYIGQYLGLSDLKYLPKNIRTARQADRTNEMWRAQYLTEVQE